MNTTNPTNHHHHKINPLPTITLLLMLLSLSSCAAIRTNAIQPALTEETAWAAMIHDWSVTAYTQRDARAGFLVGATRPFEQQFPTSIWKLIQTISSHADTSTDAYQAGEFGGSTLALYAILQGEGIKWLTNQLSLLGLIPTNILLP